MALSLEQMATLAAAGYTKADIEALQPKPALTVDALAAQVAALEAKFAGTQAAAIAAAEAPKTPTAEEILRGFVEEPTPPKV